MMVGVGGGREEQLRKEYAGPTGIGYLKLHLHRYLCNNATLYLVPETESLKSGKMIACLPIVRSYASGWCCVYFVGKRRNVFFHWLDLRSVFKKDLLRTQSVSGMSGEVRCILSTKGICRIPCNRIVFKCSIYWSCKKNNIGGNQI